MSKLKGKVIRLPQIEICPNLGRARPINYLIYAARNKVRKVGEGGARGGWRWRGHPWFDSSRVYARPRNSNQPRQPFYSLSAVAS